MERSLLKTILYGLAVAMGARSHADVEAAAKLIASAIMAFRRASLSSSVRLGPFLRNADST